VASDASANVDPATSAQAPLAPLAVNDAGAGRMLDVSRSHVRRMVAAGLMPAPVKIGSASRWPVETLRRWLELGCPPAREFAARTKGGRP
jgi:predicted DNA-binding transcriptional regulator AlpA